MTIEEDPVGALRVGLHGSPYVVRQRERDRWRPEAVDDDEPSHELGERAGQPRSLPGAERVRDDTDGPPDGVACEQREVDVEQCPREAGIDRTAVAVAAEVDRDRVV